MKKVLIGLTLACATVVSLGVQAADLEVKITKEKSYTTVKVDGELVKISRIQDTGHKIDG